MRKLWMIGLAWLTLGWAGSAKAELILGITGNNNGGYTIGGLSGGYSQVVGFAWTMTQSYSDVSISIPLLENGSSETLNAYLVRGIVPQSITNQVAATSFVTTANTTRSYTLFSGLNLAAGTYSLVLSNPNTATQSNVGWQYSANPTVTRAAGVTYPNPAYTSFDSIPPTYAPNDPNFQATNNNVTLNIQVSGTANAVPEPASVALMSLGLVGVGLLARRRLG